MAEMVACAKEGKVVLLVHGQPDAVLESPYQAQHRGRARGQPAGITGVARGRVSGEVCYAIIGEAGSSVFAQVPGVRAEQRLFQGAGARISDIDFSFADEALACTVAGECGTSAIAVLADDGKGMRTVTEGDVVDCAPRWAPGGGFEIVYASAGIGRTHAGAWVGLAPFALHRLRIADQTVEVLVADARYDYLSPVAAADKSVYAVRRSYKAPDKTGPIVANFCRIRRPHARAHGDRCSSP